MKQFIEIHTNHGDLFINITEITHIKEDGINKGTYYLHTNLFEPLKIRKETVLKIANISQ